MKTFFSDCFKMCIPLFLTGCDIIDYHPYDTRADGRCNVNAEAVSRIESVTSGRDFIRFAVISDTQRWYDETKKAVESINALGDIDFVIHCGDVSDFGVTREFTLQRDILDKLAMPYVVLLGNHDCLGTGIDTYRYVFGETDFSFTAGDTHFLCLNTNALEYDYSTPVPNFSFIKSDFASLPSGVRRTVVAMHAQPGSDQFNNNVMDGFRYELTKFPGLSFCVCGHEHHRQAEDVYGDGVIYYECGAAKSREYLVFTLLKDGSYNYEVVQY